MLRGARGRGLIEGFPWAGQVAWSLARPELRAKVDIPAAASCKGNRLEGRLPFGWGEQRSAS